MSDWILFKLKAIEGTSIESDNSGQTPKKPRIIKTFLNSLTGEISITTDLASKKLKRDVNVNLFKTTYFPYYKEQQVSCLSFVVKDSAYEKISDFMSFIKKKLKRKKLEIFGYFWIRDVGEVHFEKHYHIMIACTRLKENVFGELFKNKKTKDYDVQFTRNIKALSDYCRKKELYGKFRQRTNGRSLTYKVPN